MSCINLLQNGSKNIFLHNLDDKVASFNKYGIEIQNKDTRYHKIVIKNITAELIVREKIVPTALSNQLYYPSLFIVFYSRKYLSLEALYIMR